MMIQISSGSGPAECELAVAKFYEYLSRRIPDVNLIQYHLGTEMGTFQSILASVPESLEAYCGTILWRCQSPYRPHHKRKNWYIMVNRIPELTEEDARILEKEIRIETFRCGGKGGQNVNKVSSGVRVIHIPTGLRTESTTERSQHQNRRLAMLQLHHLLEERKRAALAGQKNDAWEKHYQIVRGNPVAVFEGKKFEMECSLAIDFMVYH